MGQMEEVKEFNINMDNVNPHLKKKKVELITVFNSEEDAINGVNGYEVEVDIVE